MILKLNCSETHKRLRFGSVTYVEGYPKRVTRKFGLNSFISSQIKGDMNGADNDTYEGHSDARHVHVARSFTADAIPVRP